MAECVYGVSADRILERVRFVGPLSRQQIREAPVRSFWLFGATPEQAEETCTRAARREADASARKLILESWLAIADERTTETGPCSWCRDPMVLASKHQLFCGQRCRQAAFRVRRRPGHE